MIFIIIKSLFYRQNVQKSPLGFPIVHEHVLTFHILYNKGFLVLCNLYDKENAK